MSYERNNEVTHYHENLASQHLNTYIGVYKQIYEDRVNHEVKLSEKTSLFRYPSSKYLKKL